MLQKSPQISRLMTTSVSAGDDLIFLFSSVVNASDNPASNVKPCEDTITNVHYAHENIEQTKHN